MIFFFWNRLRGSGTLAAHQASRRRNDETRSQEPRKTPTLQTTSAKKNKQSKDKKVTLTKSPRISGILESKSFFFNENWTGARLSRIGNVAIEMAIFSSFFFLKSPFVLGMFGNDEANDRLIAKTELETYLGSNGNVAIDIALRYCHF